MHTEHMCGYICTYTCTKPVTFGNSPSSPTCSNTKAEYFSPPALTSDQSLPPGVALTQSPTSTPQAPEASLDSTPRRGCEGVAHHHERGATTQPHRCLRPPPPDASPLSHSTPPPIAHTRPHKTKMAASRRGLGACRPRGRGLGSAAPPEAPRGTGARGHKAQDPASASPMSCRRHRSIPGRRHHPGLQPPSSLPCSAPTNQQPECSLPPMGRAVAPERLPSSRTNQPPGPTAGRLAGRASSQ